MPLRSDVHGAFGSSSLILFGTIAIAGGMFIARTRNACLLLSAILVLLLLHAMGDATPFHRWCWKYVPFCSAVTWSCAYLLQS
jgi:hypothetical protein